ncbi:hypothetical protein KY362_05250 [Candidatus Woesearchaeota archaeon]|nr:hypothetical protein [Candidatus Woesearchaeota archaeon]
MAKGSKYKVHQNNIYLSLGAVFILASAYLYLIQFASPHIIGVDGYFHIKFAELTSEEGLIRSFPWMYHTDWRTGFADSHFLYHIFLVPFTLFGLTLGAKLSSVVLGTLMITVFYYVLKKNKVYYTYIWVLLLLAMSPAFLSKISQPRAPPLSLALLLLGIWFLISHHRIGTFLLAFVFCLTYTAWPVLLVFFAVFAGVKLVREKKIEWALGLCLGGGILSGIIFNPYFPENIRVFKVQILNILFMPEVLQPFDMRPYEPIWTFFSTFWLVLVLIIISAWALLKEKHLQETKNITLLLFSLLVILLAIRSRRFSFYLIPIGLTASAMTLDRLIRKLADRIKGFRSSTRHALLAIFGVFVLVSLIGTGAQAISRNISTAEQLGLHNSRDCALWLAENTEPKDIIVVRWDQFPGFFFYNNYNYYIDALHPAYLYQHNPEKYRIIEGIYQKGDIDNISEDMQTLKSQHIVLSKTHDHDLWKLFESRQSGASENVGLVTSYEDGYYIVYSLD